MRPFIYRLSALALTFLGTATAAEQPLRIKDLQRCGDLFSAEQLTYCLRSEGLDSGSLEVRLNGEAVDIRQEDGGRLRLTLSPDGRQSGPLWLEQGGRRSNPETALERSC